MPTLAHILAKHLRQAAAEFTQAAMRLDRGQPHLVRHHIERGLQIAEAAYRYPAQQKGPVTKV